MKSSSEWKKRWTNCWFKYLLLILRFWIISVDDKLLLLPPKVSFLINFQLQAMRFFAPWNMKQKLTKAKVEGVVMGVAWMGQRIDHMDEKFEQMEKKMDKLLIQRFVINYLSLNHQHQWKIIFVSPKSKFFKLISNFKQWDFLHLETWTKSWRRQKSKEWWWGWPEWASGSTIWMKSSSEWKKRWTNYWFKDLLLIFHPWIVGINDKLFLFPPKVSF